MEQVRFGVGNLDTRDKLTKMEYEVGYKKLNVYQKANELAMEIYKTTKKFPKDEMFGLVSQMRRSAVSITANIVEGYGRRTSKDKVHFYYISRGSLNELEYYIDLSRNLGYLDGKTFVILDNLRLDVGRLLSGFMKFSEK